MIRTPRRPLSGEERRLWAEVIRSVRRLGGPAPDPVTTRAAERPGAAGPGGAAAPPEPAPPPAGTSKPAPAPPPRSPPVPRPPPLVPLERRTARALARGRTRAEGTLDLHGLTQSEAHARLVGFLRRSQGSGHGIVLVITGRGGSGVGERGVLRRVIPQWLSLPEMRSLVLGFDEAGPRQGGAGALYVRLRRRGHDVGSP